MLWHPVNPKHAWLTNNFDINLIIEFFCPSPTIAHLILLHSNVPLPQISHFSNMNFFHLLEAGTMKQPVKFHRVTAMAKCAAAPIRKDRRRPHADIFFERVFEDFATAGFAKRRWVWVQEGNWGKCQRGENGLQNRWRTGMSVLPWWETRRRWLSVVFVAYYTDFRMKIFRTELPMDVGLNSGTEGSRFGVVRSQSNVHRNFAFLQQDCFALLHGTHWAPFVIQ